MSSLQFQYLPLGPLLEMVMTQIMNQVMKLCMILTCFLMILGRGFQSKDMMSMNGIL
uniref:Uncharacterized protein n=1 Tax=Arundo donax TaxID=35708 RepID=A0A0A9AIT4_ARUDO